MPGVECGFYVLVRLCFRNSLLLFVRLFSTEVLMEAVSQPCPMVRICITICQCCLRGHGRLDGRGSPNQAQHKMSCVDLGF